MIWKIVSIDLETEGQEELIARRPPSASAARFDLSPDGRLISYMRMNDGPDEGFDLYGYMLEDPGEFRITHSNFVAETPYIKTSPAIWDEEESRFVVAFSVDQSLFVAYVDDASRAEHKLIELDDPDSSLPFHRLRLNPAFPHILFYRREAKADPNAVVGHKAPRMYLVDLRADRPEGVKLFRDGGDVQSSHPGWTSDGRKIAVANIWTEFPVVDDQGEILDTLNYTYSDGRQIGPFGIGESDIESVMYFTYSADGRMAAIATRSTKHAPGELYLMDRASEEIVFLCRTNYFGRYIAGQPRISFVGDTGKILMSTDNAWGRSKPVRLQVYLVDPGEIIAESRQ